MECVSFWLVSGPDSGNRFYSPLKGESLKKQFSGPQIKISKIEGPTEYPYTCIFWDIVTKRNL